MKHAYLILAHNKFGLLQMLLDSLDDERNDIYVHIDKKVREMPNLTATKSGLYVLENRVKVFWGAFSMVEAEERLFAAAVERGPYLYYHLLSGVDLPLKNQDYIHGFFEKHVGKEFIGFQQGYISGMIDFRMMRFHVFLSSFREYKGFKWFIWHFLLSFQTRMGIRFNRGIAFYKGSQWVSVTDGMAKYFLSSRPWIRKVFNHTCIPDESVFQTLCMHSVFKDSIFSPEGEAMGNQRLVNWNEGYQSVEDWTSSDLEVLEQSKMLFARKFNETDPLFLSKVLKLSIK